MNLESTINRGDYVIGKYERDNLSRVIFCDGYTVIIVPEPDNSEDFVTTTVKQVTRLTEEEAMLYKLSN